MWRRRSTWVTFLYRCTPRVLAKQRTLIRVHPALPQLSSDYPQHLSSSCFREVERGMKWSSSWMAHLPVMPQRAQAGHFCTWQTWRKKCRLFTQLEQIFSRGEFASMAHSGGWADYRYPDQPPRFLPYFPFLLLRVAFYACQSIGFTWVTE